MQLIAGSFFSTVLQTVKTYVMVYAQTFEIFCMKTYHVTPASLYLKMLTSECSIEHAESELWLA